MKSRRMLARESVRRVAYSSRRRAERMQLRLSANSGHTPRRFVIVFNARSGSNMVRSALDAHPNIRCEGEIFRDRQEAAIGRPTYPAMGRLRRLMVDDPETFLDQEVFGHQPHKIQARGFKLAHGHARDDHWKTVWEYLGVQGIHVIQMERRNLLAAFISQERARSSGQFVAHRSGAATWPVTLDPDACLRYFQRVRERETQAEMCFSLNPRIVVTYEDLLADRSAELRRIQDFLEVPHRELAPRTKRQSVWDPERQILNYEQIESSLLDAGFGHFLSPEGSP